jgi:hypothetical protein
VSKETIEDFMVSLERALSQPHSDMLEVVGRLRSHGLTTGLLTNNWATGDRSLLIQVCSLYTDRCGFL